jgi:two-component system response regulator FixJ
MDRVPAEPRSATRRAYVVDDGAAVRRSLTLLLRSAGYEVETFEDGETFLEAAFSGLPFGCVLLDVRMPGLDGLSVQRALSERRLPHPVIVISAHGDVPLAVEAMKAGARDFIEKPFDGDDILHAVEAALQHGSATQAEAREAAEAAARIASLSGREAEVLQGLVAGRQNKIIAQDLGISPRTVEIHRGNLMSKLGARSLPEAVRMALAAGLRPEPSGH